MKNKRYKILVLSDLKKSTINTLKSAVSLAKMINGEIEFFYVRKPTEIVENENQLSAIRVINKEHTKVDKKIQNLTNSIAQDYGVGINYKFTFGNVKNEIKDYITEQKPDIIVLGKRKSKTLNFIGDNITQFVLDNYGGVIMMVADDNTLEPNKGLSLGFLNGVDYTTHLEFAENLLKHTQKPLKLFKIVQNSNKETHISKDHQTVEYIFEQSDNIMKSLSKYLIKNNINLLCMERISNGNNDGTALFKQDVKNIIRNINISLLLTGEQKYILQ